MATVSVKGLMSSCVPGGQLNDLSSSLMVSSKQALIDRPQTMS